MCGRYTLHLSELGDLRALLGVQRVLIPSWTPRFNIAPSQLAPVVVARPEPSLLPLRWGLVPSWAASTAEGNKRINARVERLATAPSFRDAFRSRRCVVPATGFFEWRVVPGRRPATKQPYWIRPDHERVTALAGVWSTWVSPEGAAIDSFAIVTTQAEGVVRALHDRMPLSLHGEDIERWLAGDPLAQDALAALVKRSAAHDALHLIASAVDRRVSSSEPDDPGCIAPPAEGAEQKVRQLSLFSGDAPDSRGMDGEGEK